MPKSRESLWRSLIRKQKCCDDSSHSKGVETRPDRGRDQDVISADGWLIQI